MPGGIAVAPDGTVYVADSYRDRILQFSAESTLIRSWAMEGSGNEESHWPAGIAIDPVRGDVYEAVMSNDGIQGFDAEGTFLTKWGIWGAGDGKFRSPTGVAIQPNCAVVADAGNHRLQVFQPVA